MDRFSLRRKNPLDGTVLRMILRPTMDLLVRVLACYSQKSFLSVHLVEDTPPFFSIQEAK